MLSCSLAYLLKKSNTSCLPLRYSTFLTVQEFSARPQCLWSAKFAKSFSAKGWFQAILSSSCWVISVKYSRLERPQRVAYWSEFRTNHAVEVDAIPSDEIRDRLEKAILERLDAKAWENSQKKETEEKEKLRKLNRFIRGWGLDKAVEILGKDAPKPPKESIWDWLGS